MKPLALALLGLLVQAGQPAADSITAASLRGRVSFLASDLLEGRATPSRGLDIAAAYIAAEFRRADLESPAGGEYFQTAPYVQVTDAPEPAEFSFAGSEVDPGRIRVESLSGIRLANEQVFKWAPGAKIDIPLAGKILMLRAPSDPAVIGKLAFAHPDAIVELVRGSKPEKRSARLIPATDSAIGEDPVLLAVPEMDVEAGFDRLPVGLTSAKASATVPAPLVKPAPLRNVAGLLRGSDPVLRDQYIVVSAHYDHLGKTDADGIFNGANDNASGVATLLELATALSRENPHPRRTLVFVCFFGEEKGLFGSAWYVKHPLVPLAQTVADINFEQMGETASSEGLPVSSLGVTGYDYSDLPQTLEPALREAGVSLREVRHNAEFFDRSDNLSFAAAGIPAHTFVAALEYPDYHRTTDKWQKLNYENMARLDRGLAAALTALANRTETPRWNEESKKAKEYLKAWRGLHPM